MRAIVRLGVMLSLGCSASRGEPIAIAPPLPPTAPVQAAAATTAIAPAPTDTADALEELDARVEIDATVGGKNFQGVWLVGDGDERWVISYRAEPWLREFEGLRVHASGRRYSPEGQAINATHFRLESMRVLDPTLGALFVEVGPERTMLGEVHEQVGADGTKSAGSRWHVFASETDGSFELLNTPDDLVVDRRVGVRARSIVLSPYAAHRGGPMLWVLDVDASP
jgi:hypothetical protein